MVDKKKSVDGRAVVGYTLGILGIIFALISPFAGIVISIVGLFQSLKEKNELGRKAKILNIIGLILGVIVFALTILLVYFGYSNSIFPTD